MKGYHYLFSSITLLALSSTPVFAEEFDPFFEILLMGGVAAADADNTNIDVSPSETDTLVQTNDNDWDAFLGQVGVGYMYPLFEDAETGDVLWFSAINPQLNLYVMSETDISGDVWRFESPDWNQGNYTVDFNSTRLMFDLGLTVAQIDDFSIYALGGAGVAWNETSFNAVGKDGLVCPIDSVNLNEEDSTSFVYEFGGGLTYAATNNFAISLEYLYTVFEDVELGDDDLQDVDGGDMNINTQAVLLGLRFAI